jgi:non-ribosomal peptide synthase protein (TIGR01720 family)
MGSSDYESIEGIAIIGMAGRFPGAKNTDDFWQNLQDGVESISFFTDDELIGAGINPSLLEDNNYVKAGGVLEDIDLFDAAFFEINPKEAENTDPQHRLFLETAWEALESAGYDSTKSENRIGVYAGTSLNNYLPFDLNHDQVGSAQSYQKLIGNDKDFLTTRVSYKLNLTGPSITIQTACSSSLVAINLACQSLLNYQCDMALAGGVSIRVPQKTGYLHQQGGTLSPDGHCRAFDAKAQGTTIGSGVGVVVLKRLADAITDRDYIYGVIKGAAINNDGSVKVGYTAPSVDGQAIAFAEAIMLAGIEPETISYIEAHGTGTALGDPIEVSALTKVFRANTEKKGFCAIGSVKTNIGHLDAAAGVTGLIKTALALKHQLIPPSLNFEQSNPEIDFANSPFYVNTKLTAWKAGKTPRRAGVSSLGMGGTNAYVVLEEAPTLSTSSNSRPQHLLVISAKTRSSLETTTQNLAQYLEKHPELNLADVAYTLQVGRREFNYRHILVCQDIPDAVKALLIPVPQRVFTQHQDSNRIIFMFPGQGSQYINMGRELYQTEATFRAQVDKCCVILQSHLELDLRSIIYPSESNKATAAETLKQTSFAQPALFVIEYALAQLWISWGISPQAMIGHSIGEYVAACLADVISVEDALALIAIRGKLMQQMPSGAMLSIPLSETEVQPLLNENLSLAAINAPKLSVVSGTHEAIEILSQQLAAKGVEYRHLHTSHAFHSQMMEPILEAFIAAANRARFNPPQIPFISNLTGTWITVEQATNPEYWAQHLRQTVRFSAGIAELRQQPDSILLEVGASRTLSTFAKQYSTQEEQQIILSSLPHPQEQKCDIAFLLNTLGHLWLSGVTVDWGAFYTHEQRVRIPLPTYAFERQRYWIEREKNKSDSAITKGKKPDIADWFYVLTWKQTITPQVKQSRKQALVFADNCQIQEKIAKPLLDEGCSLITVVPGEGFHKLSTDVYSINPQQPEDYDALIAQLQLLEHIPDVIVHLWSVTSQDTVLSKIEFFNSCQNLGFYSLLYLVQSFGKQDITQPIDILVVTSDIYNVTGSERLSPEKATILGMCKVIPQEYQNIKCRNIDVALPISESILEKELVELLLLEISAKSVDTVVAYRGNHRWIQTFESIRCETATPPFREKGVYLIAGGLGGIGLELAEYLAQIPAKLILIGASAFPSKDEWDEWLVNHDETNQLSRKIRKLQEIEKLGGEVIAVSADVTDIAQMQAVINLALQCFGQINGVIYAAGIKLFKTIPEITINECEEQFKANVSGLFVLEKVLEGIELDFCLLISSLSSVLGALGMAAYPAAHLFTDAFVSKHNQTSHQSWISVNLDNWLTSQLAIELANKSEISTDLFMNNREGVEVFQRILSLKKVNQIVISTTNLQSRLEQWIKPKNLSHQSNSQPRHSRPNLSNTYVESRNEIEQIIINIWQEVLSIAQVGIYDNFLELGGDSLLSIQVTAKANKAGLRMSSQQLFAFPTVAQLAEVVTKTQPILAEQELVEGEISLTPIQHWFFEQNLKNPHHWNQAVVLEVQKNLEPALLKEAFRHLLRHHDALRLCFTADKSGWKQINAAVDGVVLFSQIDLSLSSLQEQAFETKATELQASLNLASGVLLHVALFDLGQHQPKRLLLLAHHLAVDVGSWRILLDDLETAYHQLSQGKVVKLPLKTTSFKHWSQRLIKYSQSTELREEEAYWLNLSQQQVFPLPLDYANGANTEASAQIISVALSMEETQILQQEITTAYRVNMKDLLLAALLQAINKWTGNNSLLVDLEENGREVIFDDVDLSRTVGWFTNIAPVFLDIKEVDEVEEVIKTVKDQIRSFPNQGLGYGVLRYLQDNKFQMELLQKSEILFLYLGNLEQTLPKSSLFKLSPKSGGLTRSLEGERSHVLEIQAAISQNKLTVDWSYSQNIHRQETVQQIANDFLATLRSIINHRQSSSITNYTPSDFADFKSSQWNQADINNILAGIQQT